MEEGLDHDPHGIVFWFPSIQGKTTIRARHKVVRIWGWAVIPTRFYHLRKAESVSRPINSASKTTTYPRDLAQPPLLTFMRPPICKGFPPRSYHARTEWVIIAVIFMFPRLLLDTRVDRPSTVGRMFQVLFNWVIAFLPSIEALAAKEAFHAI